MRQYPCVPLSTLDENQRNDLVSLHLRTMPTLLTELGNKFVEKYYKYGIFQQQAIGFAAIADDESVVGWVFGTPNPSAIYKNLANPLFWLVKEIGALLLQKPQVIRSLFRSLLPNHNNYIPLGQIELTYIGTHPDFQQQGIGNILIRQFITEARKMGFSQVSLSVETDNPTAINLYKKNGFIITATFTEGSYHRHRMVLDLE